ncbi:MAG: DNA topoisomerase, partial [Candidatus Limnocylindria bacterium]
WGLEAKLVGDGTPFSASLARTPGGRLASGKDFDPATGQLKDAGMQTMDEASAGALRDALRGRLPWTVTTVDERPARQAPAAPFTTSTLQQEANRKLNFSADRTMSAAQRLFQEGMISYHRTDSTSLSERALRESADAIRSLYGDEYYGGPREYKTKVKNAQEAHEAIRPTEFGRTPQRLGAAFGRDEIALYDLVWKRAVASQMGDARLSRTSLEITASGPDGDHVFTASGKAVQFAGYLRAYVEGSDDPAAELGDQETVLPKLEVGDVVTVDGSLALTSLEAKSHETSPPARYTDASLVKRLEEDGIGRPSTYASIISTIERRGYVWRQGKALVPTFTAYAVTNLLKEHFSALVELGFTGQIEENLDEIAKGELDRDGFLATFYHGDRGRDWPGLRSLVENETQIEYPVIHLGQHPESGAGVVIRIGRFGPYVQLGEGDSATNASVPEDIPPADFTLEQAIDLVETRARGPAQLGTDPASGLPIYLMTGRFGPYVQLGETPEKGSGEKPRRASLTRADSPGTMTAERAVELLALPRLVGKDPTSGEEIVTNFGRFGPYVKRGDDFRSLASDSMVFEVSLDEALHLLSQEKPSRRRGAKVLRELGAHPTTGTSLQLLEGRYGPYVTDGTTNASLPKDLVADDLTLERAVALLQEREASGTTKKPRRGGSRNGASRGTTRRAPARKRQA